MTHASTAPNEGAPGTQEEAHGGSAGERDPNGEAHRAPAERSGGEEVAGEAQHGRGWRIGLGIALGAVTLAHLLLVHLYQGGVSGMRAHMAYVHATLFGGPPVYPWDDHILALIRPAHRITAMLALGLLLLAGGMALRGRRSPRARAVAWGASLGAVLLALVSRLAQVEHWTLSASLPWGSFLLPARGLLVGLSLAALGFAGSAVFRGRSGPRRAPRVARGLLASLVAVTISLCALLLVPTAPLYSRPREVIAVCENGLHGDFTGFAGVDAYDGWGGRQASPPVVRLLQWTRRARALRLARGARDSWATGRVRTFSSPPDGAPPVGATPEQIARQRAPRFFSPLVTRTITHYGELEMLNLGWNQVRAPGVALLPFGALGLLGLTLLVWLRRRSGAALDSSPLPGWLRWAWGVVGVVALVISLGPTPVLSNWAWWYYLPGGLTLPLAVAFGLLTLRGRPAAASSPSGSSAPA